MKKSGFGSKKVVVLLACVAVSVGSQLQAASWWEWLTSGKQQSASVQTSLTQDMALLEKAVKQYITTIIDAKNVAIKNKDAYLKQRKKDSAQIANLAHTITEKIKDGTYAASIAPALMITAQKEVDALLQAAKQNGQQLLQIYEKNENYPGIELLDINLTIEDSLTAINSIPFGGA